LQLHAYKSNVINVMKMQFTLNSKFQVWTAFWLGTKWSL